MDETQVMARKLVDYVNEAIIYNQQDSHQSVYCKEGTIYAYRVAASLARRRNLRKVMDEMSSERELANALIPRNNHFTREHWPAFPHNPEKFEDDQQFKNAIDDFYIGYKSAASHVCVLAAMILKREI